MVPAHLVQKYFGLDGVDRKDLVDWSFWNQYDVFHNQPFDLKPPEQFQYIVKKHSQVTEKLVFYIGTLLLRKSIAVLSRNLARPDGAGPASSRRSCARCSIHADAAGHARRHGQAHGPLQIRRARWTSRSKRVGVNAGGLLIGAIETTSQAVAQVIEYFVGTDKDAAPDLRTKAAAPTRPHLTRWCGRRCVSFRSAPTCSGRRRRTTRREGNGARNHNPQGHQCALAVAVRDVRHLCVRQGGNLQSQSKLVSQLQFRVRLTQCLGKYIGMVMIPEMVRQIMLRKRSRAPARSAARTARATATARGPARSGPFPEEYN